MTTLAYHKKRKLAKCTPGIDDFAGFEWLMRLTAQTGLTAQTDLIVQGWSFLLPVSDIRECQEVSQLHQQILFDYLFRQAINKYFFTIGIKIIIG